MDHRDYYIEAVEEIGILRDDLEEMTARAEAAEAERDALAAELAAMRGEAGGDWVAETPDGVEWFGSRSEAEAHVVEWFTEALAYDGEGHEPQGHVARVVAYVAEVVDDSDEAREAAQEGGYDYHISGYRMVPTGPDGAFSAAEAAAGLAETERAQLRAVLRPHEETMRRLAADGAHDGDG